jgi:hypothetical protein
MNGVSGVDLASGFVCLTSKEKSANATTTVLFGNLLSTQINKKLS